MKDISKYITEKLELNENDINESINRDLNTKNLFVKDKKLYFQDKKGVETELTKEQLKSLKELNSDEYNVLSELVNGSKKYYTKQRDSKDNKNDGSYDWVYDYKKIDNFRKILSKSLGIKDTEIYESESVNEAEKLDPSELYKKANKDLSVIIRELGLGAKPRIDELWSGSQGLQVECKISSLVEYPIITLDNMKTLSKLKSVRYISFRDFQHGYFQVYFKHENEL